MIHGEDTFNGVGNTTIYYQFWLPRPLEEGLPRAVIAVSHGLGEHSGRYQYLAADMAARNLGVFALDHRGHGRSGGQRGYINRWEELREDLHAFLALVRQQVPDRPLFLLGHSLGGLIALDYALTYPDGLSGVIGSAPAVMQTAITPLKVLLAKSLSRIIPRLSLASGLDPEGIARDPQEVERYRQDPLVHDRGTTRLGAEAFAVQDRTLAAAADLRPPLLLVHGEADRLVPLLGSETVFDRVRHQEKRFIRYPGGYHELHNDLQRQQYFEDLDAWITERC